MHLTKKFVTKFLKYLILFTLFLIIVILDLGKYLDASDKPQKADVIVCLGGGAKDRIATAIQLYENGYSKQNILILTGDNRSKIRIKQNLGDKRIEYLKKHNYLSVNLFQNKSLKNTKQEIIFIKKYLLKHKYTSAIIVSNTPHTRRIKILIHLLKVHNDDNLKFYIVGSEEKWWNSAAYYKNKQARMFASREIVKILYAYIVYDLLKYIGFNEDLDKNHDITTLKKEVNKILIITFK